MKNFRIEFENGEIFEVPLEVIAHNRTSYYAENDGFIEGSDEWNDEWKQSMRPDEIEDWVQNNMNWEDVAADAKLVGKREDKGYDEMWSTADFSVN